MLRSACLEALYYYIRVEIQCTRTEKILTKQRTGRIQTKGERDIVVLCEVPLYGYGIWIIRVEKPNGGALEQFLLKIMGVRDSRDSG